MTNKNIKEITSFLKMNGFKLISKQSYSNDLCNVYVTKYHIVIEDNKGYQFFGTEIVWMIGFLTFFGYIDKNYKQ